MRVGSGEGEGGRRGVGGSGDTVSSVTRWIWRRGEGTIPMTTSHTMNYDPNSPSVVYIVT